MRWYDKHEKLRKYLDMLKDMDSAKRDAIVKKVLGKMKEECPRVLDCETVLDFPLSMNRRRWYDNDPYTWLMFNGLERSTQKFIKSVTDLLEKEIG